MTRYRAAFIVAAILSVIGQFGLAHSSDFGIGFLLMWGLPGYYVATLLGLQGPDCLAPSRVATLIEVIVNFTLYFAALSILATLWRKRKTRWD